MRAYVHTFQVGCEVTRPGVFKKGYLYCHEARYHHDSQFRLHPLFLLVAEKVMSAQLHVHGHVIDFAALT